MLKAGYSNLAVGYRDDLSGISSDWGHRQRPTPIHALVNCDAFGNLNRGIV